MARSPSSYSAFGMNNNSNIKRPPLWPMDRPPMLPFPRQPLTPSQSSKAANLQHIPCKFFKSGACTAGKNCLFSHSRDPPSENFVCKYFLKGNCKFGAKCSLSHSFLALDRKTSALMPGGGGSLGRNNRLERRASSGAILNNPWAPEPLSPPYTSSLSQQQALQFSNNNNNNNVEFTMGGRSPNQQGFFKPALNKATSDGLRNAVYMTPPTEVGNGSGGHRSPYSEDDNTNADANGNERVVHPLSLLESRVRQHLAAPLPIRQRSLPDIFRLTPLSHDGPSMGGTSPFHQPGNKGLFLSVSSSENEVTPSSPLRLHSIPELHDLVVQDDNDDDDDHHNDLDGDEFSDSEGSDQGFLPSSLNDLLTTHERQRRQSRQDDVDPRLNMLPSPASGSLRGDKDEDDARFGYGALSSVPGVSQQTDFRPQFQSRFTDYDGSSHETSVSPLAMLIPNNQMAMAPYPFQDQSSYETVEDLSYQRQHPHYHQQPQPQQLRGLSNDQGPHYKERNLTPDPFCPFPSDAEEVQFVMDDDVVASSAGTGRAHNSAGGGGRGGQSIIAAQRDHDKRAGLFVDDAARATAVAGKELNRAVGSQSTIQSGRPQQPQGTLTPVSLNSREDDTAEGAGAAVSSVAMDFSALTISSNSSISSGAELFDLSGSTVSAPTSYAGIARSQKSSF
ncbi:hypothetical protein BGZ72_006959 [Mortierella alpina]|nr:hypothetical protein BGZ72_006959 [Mortierella alpina]